MLSGIYWSLLPVRASLVLLAAIPGLMKFDPLYWWAGRLWGERIIALLGGRRDRGTRYMGHVQRWGRKFTWPAVVLSNFLPIPGAIIYVIAGWAGMSPGHVLDPGPGRRPMTRTGAPPSTSSGRCRSGPCHGVCWAPRKHPARLRATYHRTHGIRYFHGCYALGDDQLWGVLREHKGARQTLAALKSIRAARPAGYRLLVIMDKPVSEQNPAIRAWVKQENVELCFTPTNASWANPIEAQFGPLRTFVMGNSNYSDHPALAHRL